MADNAVAELSESLRRAIAGLEAKEGLEKVGIVTRVGETWQIGRASCRERV